MTWNVWVVEICDPGAASPKWEVHSLDFGAAVEIARAAIAQGEKVRVRNPLHALQGEIDTLLKLGVELCRER